ncbi:YbaK / prolyl-tRNA synthetases associated domain protein [Desulfosporosinus acididurans]|uniref:YbaK / prolyl-tRNA synthetases associated domain protein n=2 Tax=Desulfosporosinus acididurans TaxID=476652 RepID=A0A0J1FP35_9FIRM|nr:YbaK / prolyl-tRNA synthetases associated domain protein [Desulfosporosinus acididurans]
MEKHLNIKPGSVSVLGLVNDISQSVQLLIDKDVLQSEYVGCHPCVNTSSPNSQCCWMSFTDRIVVDAVDGESDLAVLNVCISRERSCYVKFLH